MEEPRPTREPETHPAIRSLTRWHRPAAGGLHASIGDSRFEFTLDCADAEFRDACDVGLRRNPSRRFLFVSRVLGRHWPTRPGALRTVADRLAAKVVRRASARRLLFVGMSETATALGQAVFAAARARGAEVSYVESTRRRTGAPIAFEFDERHSHAVRHAIHAPPGSEAERGIREAEVIVIVDDECTTGRTAAACIASIESWTGRRREAILSTILHWKDDSNPAGAALPVESLISGRFRFEADPTQIAHAPASRRASQIAPVTGARVGARHGLREPEHLEGLRLPAFRGGERVLVVGTGEHGYVPLLVAEHAERHGATAWLQATTRSPIELGGAIAHVRTFEAITGEGYDEYLYNVPHDHPYDRVILCTEESPPPAVHPVWGLPRIEVIS